MRSGQEQRHTLRPVEGRGQSTGGAGGGELRSYAQRAFCASGRLMGLRSGKTRLVVLNKGGDACDVHQAGRTPKHLQRTRCNRSLSAPAVCIRSADIVQDTRAPDRQGGTGSAVPDAPLQLC